MKNFFFISIFMVLLSTTGQAETQYVLGVLEITMRTGPGTDHRVLSLLKTGQNVNVINAENKDWTQIKLADGREGWVLSRFLTAKKPSALVLEQTSQQNQTLSLQVTELQEENKTLKEGYNRVKSELAQNKKTLAAINKSYERLKKESSEYLEVSKKYKKSTSDLSIQIERSDRLEKQLSKLRFYQNIKWFLSGGGVLLVGFLLGLSARRQRRRSSLL